MRYVLKVVNHRYFEGLYIGVYPNPIFTKCKWDEALSFKDLKRAQENAEYYNESYKKSNLEMRIVIKEVRDI